MQRFVARENIKRFKRHLENCSDPDKETLKRLLVAEEEKLKELDRAYGKSSKGTDSTVQALNASPVPHSGRQHG